MKTLNSLRPVHRHVLATIIIAGLIALFGVLVYPKLATLAQGPNMPTDVRATEGDTEVMLEWIPGEENRDMPLTNYLIFVVAGKDEREIDTMNTDPSYTVTELENGVEYSFSVRAASHGNTSAATEPVFATPRGAGGEEITITTSPQAMTTSTGVTITWGTSVAASSQVHFGPASDFRGETLEYNTDERVTDHEVVIENLTPCAAYWYQVVSVDSMSAEVMSGGGEFKTTGCKGDSAIVTYSVGKVTTSTGATVEAKVAGRGIEVGAPANIKAGVAEMAIEAMKLEKEKVRLDTSVPSGRAWVGAAYSLKIFEDESSEFDEQFDHPVDVTIDYVPSEVEGYDINTLKIYHYTDGIGWEPLSNCVVDTGALTVTCQTTSFSIFGLFGEAPSSSETTSGSRGSTVTAPISVPTKPVAPAAPTNMPVAPVAYRFTKDLAESMQDADVMMLQKFLNGSGFVLAPTGPGSTGMETDYFGPRTLSALIRFQEMYRAEILIPLGLDHGTGFFGPKTREFANSLMPQ